MLVPIPLSSHAQLQVYIWLFCFVRQCGGEAQRNLGPQRNFHRSGTGSCKGQSLCWYVYLSMPQALLPRFGWPPSLQSVEAERCFERAADGRFQKSVENQGLPAQLDQNGGCGWASQALSCRCPRTSQALDLSVSDTHGARWSAADVGREVWLPWLFYIPSHGVGCLPGLFDGGKFKKKQLTIWTARWCSTPRAIPEKRLKLNFNRCPLKLQADGRMTKSKGARPAGKRRKHMTFSELTDFVLERKVSTVAALWQAGGWKLGPNFLNSILWQDRISSLTAFCFTPAWSGVDRFTSRKNNVDFHVSFKSFIVGHILNPPNFLLPYLCRRRRRKRSLAIAWCGTI